MASSKVAAGLIVLPFDNVRKREAIADTGASKVVVAGVTVVAMLVGVAGFLTWEYRSRQRVGFALGAQKAAVTAGVHRRIAAQFAAALGEMVSNIHEHSDRPATGIAEGWIRGIRVRGRRPRKRHPGGLQSCADFAHLDDHGQALRLALTDGVSRYGPQAKRVTCFILMRAITASGQNCIPRIFQLGVPWMLGPLAVSGITIRPDF